MNFRTRSYFLIPLIPNIRESFEVDHETRTLFIKRLFGKIEKEEINTKGLSIAISRGSGFKHVVNLIFRSGNIILTGSEVNGKRILKNIYNVKGLKDAIGGKRIASSNQKEIKNENAINKNIEFSEKDLGDIIVYYPHIPKLITGIVDYRAFRKHLRSKPAYRIERQIGDLVNEGDIIAKYGTVMITAASKGQIVFLSRALPGKLNWTETLNNVLVYPKEHSKEDCYSVGIRILDPKQGLIANRINKFYRIPENIRSSRNNPEQYDSFGGLLTNAMSKSISLPKNLRDIKVIERCWDIFDTGYSYTESISGHTEKDKDTVYSS